MKKYFDFQVKGLKIFAESLACAFVPLLPPAAASLFGKGTLLPAAVTVSAISFVLALSFLTRSYRNHGFYYTGDVKYAALMERLESNEPFRSTLKFIYRSFSPYVPYTHIGVALIDNQRGTVRASYFVSSKAQSGIARRLSGFEIPICQTSLGQVIKSSSPRVINDLPHYLSGRPLTEYNRILTEEGVKSSITFPLINAGVPVGIIFFSSDKTNIYRKRHVKFLNTLAKSIMSSLEKDILLDDMVVSSTLALARMAEDHDETTGSHLERMKRYSKLLAFLMSRDPRFSSVINNDFVTSIERFSPLHDIGKVAIRDSILLKPGRLTAAEFEIMKTHTTYGARVLQLADENIKLYGKSIFRMGIEITKSHHERWDGQGYPEGLYGRNIPLSARIVSVADNLDALTSKRPYKKAICFDRSVEIIYDGSGTRFDPDIIDVFMNNIAAFRKLYESCSIALDDCENAHV